jgi:hypothetical protein
MWRTLSSMHRSQKATDCTVRRVVPTGMQRHEQAKCMRNDGKRTAQKKGTASAAFVEELPSAKFEHQVKAN